MKKAGSQKVAKVTKAGIRERYYAVRIGDPRRHFPYFMLGGDSKTAEKQSPENSSAKVVCVWVVQTRELRPT